MSNVTKVIKEITLDLENIPFNAQSEAKKEVGDYIVNEILREVADGRSPVQGESKFQRLDKKYAKKEKGGQMLANLELEGDLLSALKFTDLGADRIEIGVRGKEAPKADGHNQLSFEAKNWARQKKFPKRRFIPDDNQSFKKNIMREVDSILQSYRVETVQPSQPKQSIFNSGNEIKIDTTVSQPSQTSIDINNIFTDENLFDTLLKQVGR